MVDMLSLKTIQQKAETEKWSYPHIFEALKKIGIVNYKVHVASHEITYSDGINNLHEQIPGAVTVDIPFALDQSALKQALQRIQQGITDYPVFLQEIAQAGVTRYYVDMAARTISYQSAIGQEYIEKVPEVS